MSFGDLCAGWALYLSFALCQNKGKHWEMWACMNKFVFNKMIRVFKQRLKFVAKFALQICNSQQLIFNTGSNNKKSAVGCCKFETRILQRISNAVWIPLKKNLRFQIWDEFQQLLEPHYYINILTHTISLKSAKKI